MRYTLYYRGALSTCNYLCWYCPFHKGSGDDKSLMLDRKQLEQFVGWIKSRGDKKEGISIVFTPWGEALIHPWYTEGIVLLSHLHAIEKVVIQTNLSGSLEWVKEADKNKVALWTTYHPEQVSLEEFAAQCNILDESGIRYSVGVVGIKDDKKKILELRQKLLPQVYLWVNAYKDEKEYYSKEDVCFFEGIDPYFRYNLRSYASKGEQCCTGKSVFFIQGDGAVRRCHFDSKVLGNIYNDDIKDVLIKEPCRNESCGCYIGYVHMPRLNFKSIYGNGLLERVPLI
ncbi:MAG: STM4011 family radical SAM protein [Clostridia bacterium]|nr:STM4011 family radical SAM protein [Clostridia bacterium]